MAGRLLEGGLRGFFEFFLTVRLASFPHCPAAGFSVYVMKNAGMLLRPGEIEFFLRLHGLLEGIVALPPPHDPPFNIETMEPLVCRLTGAGLENSVRYPKSGGLKVTRVDKPLSCCWIMDNG